MERNLRNCFKDGYFTPFCLGTQVMLAVSMFTYETVMA